MKLQNIEGNSPPYGRETLKNNHIAKNTENDKLFLYYLTKNHCMEQLLIEDPRIFSNEDFEPSKEAISIPSQQYFIAATSSVCVEPQFIQTQPLSTLSTASIKQTSLRIINQSVESFIKSIWPHAKKSASLIGVDPKLLLAQVALETGWGQSVAKDSNGSSSNNLFNIKATKGSLDSIQVNTQEYIDNETTSTQASFKKYSSLLHSFTDYIDLIKLSPRYQKTLEQANNPEQYVKELEKAGYATDPHYAEKLLSIYHGDLLNQMTIGLI